VYMGFSFVAPSQERGAAIPWVSNRGLLLERVRTRVIAVGVVDFRFTHQSYILCCPQWLVGSLFAACVSNPCVFGKKNKFTRVSLSDGRNWDTCTLR
jgi:hypothetical protein